VNAKHLTLVIAAGVAVSGCGATAVVLASAPRTVATVAMPRAAATAVAPATAVPTVAPAPPPPPQVIVTAAEADTSGTSFLVTLVSTTGTVLASAAAPADARWTVGAGPGGAYWVTGGTLENLDARGELTTIATVPSTEAGRVVNSPDGSEWAYATMSQSSSGVVTNRLYRVGRHEAPVLIAERTADPAHPSADAPGLWQYYPMSWTAKGILIERQPLGGCGCGTPFDMEMSAGYTAFIDPATGTATPVTESNTCPLSGTSGAGTAACFEGSSTGGSASLDLLDNLHVTARYPMSGRNLGGEAIFNGSTLAYATVPKTAGGCGGSDWHPQTTLRVMDIRTGDARAVGPTGFGPVAWLNDGTIVGTLSIAAPAGTTSTVVVIDPVTGHVTTILDRSAMVVGVAGS
jgi:hypothetical protein